MPEVKPLKQKIKPLSKVESIFNTIDLLEVVCTQKIIL